MNELHADPLQADVAAVESTNATSYGDLTTTGPSVTKSLVNGQKVKVTISARIDSPAIATTEGYMSFAVSGAGTQAASDTHAATLLSTSVAGLGMVLEKTTVYTATATGSYTFTCKYKSSSGSATYEFRRRRIIVKPF